MPVILASQEAEIRRITVGGQCRQIVKRDPMSKIPNTKKANRVAQVAKQVVEHLLSKHGALSSSSSTAKRKS
jgi:hypothetical protein